MTNRLLILIVLAAYVLLSPFARAAAAAEPYTAERLAALQATDAPVLIDVRADWCPTCKKQAEVLSVLLAEPAFAGFRVLNVDWDAQRDVARALGAPRQSTLIVFRGSEQRALSVAETDIGRLRDVLATAVD